MNTKEYIETIVKCMDSRLITSKEGVERICKNTQQSKISGFIHGTLFGMLLSVIIILI